MEADGSVSNIEIIESSGHKILDDSVIRIIRLAEPFAPFTEQMLKEMDRLEIIRTFDFGSRLSSFQHFARRCLSGLCCKGREACGHLIVFREECSYVQILHVFLRNQFLIAMPHLRDKHFEGTITYICRAQREWCHGDRYQ